jgi:hypothetical protein
MLNWKLGLWNCWARSDLQSLMAMTDQSAVVLAGQGW